MARSLARRRASSASFSSCDIAERSKVTAEGEGSIPRSSLPCNRRTTAPLLQVLCPETGDFLRLGVDEDEDHAVDPVRGGLSEDVLERYFPFPNRRWAGHGAREPRHEAQLLCVKEVLAAKIIASGAGPIAIVLGRQDQVREAVLAGGFNV